MAGGSKGGCWSSRTAPTRRRTALVVKEEEDEEDEEAVDQMGSPATAAVVVVVLFEHAFMVANVPCGKPLTIGRVMPSRRLSRRAG